MAKIKQLSPLVADLIAAGEVVERPASVVKELVENSIDAGATQITVEIKNGGMSYIRVSDNGCGMSEEDAKVAFLRHATSKLRTARDLEAIGTLGFRGEALAAISAVSKVELTTKEPGTESGTKVEVSGGNIISSSPAGCPDGTTLVVRDLFFNTPARLKFIKNDRAEGSAVSSVIIRCALSHPEVSLKYIKDGKEECHTPGDGRMDSCIYSVFGGEFASKMLSAQSADDKIKVTGYVSSPSAVRGNRTRQYFFVNGRFIKSKTMQAALERAYSNCLFTGKYPSCVLYIDINYGAVDVNVHPTKTEVKFSDEGKVFSAVYSAVLGALDGENKDGASADIALSQSTKNAISDHMFSGSRGGSSTPPLYSPQEKDNTSPGIGAYRSHTRGHISSTSSAFRGGYGIKNSTSGYSFLMPDRNTSDETISKYDTFRQPDLSAYQTKLDAVLSGSETSNVDNEHLNTDQIHEDFQIIGECLNTYIIVEQGECVILIDKHAAHERIIFDKLCQTQEPVMSQITLAPIVCDLSPEDASIIMDNQELLSQIGFEIDQFSERAMAVRQLPADIETGDVKPLLEEMCEKLRSGDESHMLEKRHEILHTVACKAAIKAGKKSHPSEFYGIVKAVLSGEIKYCPHGRPVSIRLTKRDIDHQFRRV